MRTILLSAALSAATLCFSAGAQTRYYVDKTAAGANNGLTWTDAFKKIEDAFAAATAGDTVWIGAGFYLLSGTAHVPAGVTVEGRHLAGGAHDAQREVNFQTVLFGAGTDRVLTMGAGSSIDGLNIQNGTTADPAGGGGLLIDGVDCIVSRCFFLQNNAPEGAAIMVRNGANPTIESCAIYLNGDASTGAAVAVDNAAGRYINLTIDTNGHSGLRAMNGATPAIHNTIFSNNGQQAGTTARGIERLDTSSLTMTSNLFHNNFTSLVLDGAAERTTIGQVNAMAGAADNLAGDPQFTFTASVFTVPVTSPVVDAGSWTEWPTRLHGLYDNGRVLNGTLDNVYRIDIGAYEYSDIELRVPTDVHQHIHVGANSLSGKQEWILLGFAAAPSPFRFGTFGYFFIDVSTLFIFPLPSNNIIDYSGAGIPAGVPLFLQAMTFNNIALVLSHAAVHITNP